MSLRDLARQRLAIIRGETGDETDVKQRNSMFHEGGPCSPLMKRFFPRKSPITALVSLFHRLGGETVKQACLRP